MGAHDILFGRAVRFTCDSGNCDARQTTTGEPPDGWAFFEGEGLWACPKHVADIDFDDLCSDMDT